MNPIDHKKVALNEVFNDINLLGYPRTFVYFAKGPHCIKEHPKIVGNSLDKWFTLFGKTAKEQGAERVYFFMPSSFINADQPKPVPLDDVSLAIHIFCFDISGDEFGKASRSYIEYKNPSKKVHVYPERYLAVGADDPLLTLFFEAYNSAEEVPE